MSTHCGPCSYCALLLCGVCITQKRCCHGHENGRTLCSNHAKRERVISVPNNRVALCDKVVRNGMMQNVNNVEVKKIELSSDERIEIFSSFYSDMKGLGKKFAIFDALDTIIWERELEFESVMVFVSMEACSRAKQLYPSAFQSLEEDVLLLAACSQCNGYQVRYPVQRLKNPKLTKYDIVANCSSYSLVLPNFYSEGLCRKPNISHEKKKKLSRKNLAVNSLAPSEKAGRMPKKQKLEHAEDDPQIASKNAATSLLSMAAHSTCSVPNAQPLISNAALLHTSASMISSNFPLQASGKSISSNLSLSPLRAPSLFSVKNGQMSPTNLFQFGRLINSCCSSPSRSPQFPNFFEVPQKPCADNGHNFLKLLDHYSQNQVVDWDLPAKYFREQIALSLFAAYQFDEFRNYLDSYLSNAIDEPFVQFRMETLRWLSFELEMHSIKVLFAPPCLPMFQMEVLRPREFLLFDDQEENQKIFGLPFLQKAEIFITFDQNLVGLESEHSIKAEGVSKLLSAAANVDTSIYKQAPIAYLFFKIFELKNINPVFESPSDFESHLQENAKLLLYLQDAAHYLWQCGEVVPVQIKTLKQLVCSIYNNIADASLKARSWNKRKTALIHFSQRSVRFDQMQSFHAFAIQFCSNLHPKFSNNYLWIDCAVLYFALLKFAKLTSPSLCLLHVSNQASFNFLNIKKYDFSVAGIAVEMLLLSAYEIMDQILTDDYIQFLHYLSTSEPYMSLDSAEQIQLAASHSFDLCHASCILEAATESDENNTATLTDSSLPNSYLILDDPAKLLAMSFHYSKPCTKTISLDCNCATMQADDFIRALPRNSGNQKCSPEIVLRWLNLAKAFVNQELIDCWVTAKNLWLFALFQLLWIRDFNGGLFALKELEHFLCKILNRCSGTEIVDATKKKLFALLVHSSSLRLQCLQHTIAKIVLPFFPGQLIHFDYDNAGPICTLVGVYINFGPFDPSLYVANIPGKGDCWANYGADLRLQSSWFNVSFDSLHSPWSRLLLRVLMKKEYSVEQFQNDIRERSMTQVK